VIEYTFPVIITNSREVLCKELKNVHYKNIQKLIQNNDNENLCIYFEAVVEELCVTKEPLNYIDKFIILLALRMISVSGVLEISTKSEIKNTLEIGTIAKTILENFFPNTKTIRCDDYNIKVDVGYPYTISNKNILFDKIHTIEIDGTKVALNLISQEERDQILSLMPASISKDILKEITNTKDYKQIKLFTYFYEEGKTADYYFSFDSTKNFDLLKMIFSDNLQNCYYYEYVCVSKLHISLYDYLYYMTPVESILQIKTLSKEIKEQNDAQKAAQNTNKQPAPGLGAPR